MKAKVTNTRLKGSQVVIIALRLGLCLAAVLASLAGIFRTLISDDWDSSSSSIAIGSSGGVNTESERLNSLAKNLTLLGERVEKLEWLLHQHEQNGDVHVQTTASILADPTTAPTRSFDIPNNLSHLQVTDLQGESFSACMLVMDENIRLGEWLAYHYFTLPLRHLVLAIDPRSKTSPSAIVDRWRPFMNITLWSDDDILDRKWLRRAKNLNQNSTMIEKRNVHRQRQGQFFRRCTFFLKKQNLTWTTFHDVDEYIAFDSHMVNNTEALLRQPGSILRFLKHVRSTQPNNTHYQKPCITIPRTIFGAVESSSDEIRKDVPSFVDPKQFNTLRYRHYAGHSDEANGPVKGIVDVSLVPDHWRKFEVHRPISNLCSTPYIWESLFTIHHYIGSWEVYSFKDDARRGSSQRGKSDWESRASMQKVKNNDDARPWIQGFVDWIGEPLAQHLLQDIGPPVNFSGSTVEWE